jgi:hypothetical protein
MMPPTKKHKPYITGKERGKWFQILGYLEPGHYVCCTAEEIGRARSALYQLYNNKAERFTKKIDANTFQLWRIKVEPRKVTLTASIAHARPK